MKKIEINHSEKASNYEIVVGDGILESVPTLASKILGNERTAFVISNPTVWKEYGELVETSFSNGGFGVGKFLMEDGEVHKNSESLFSALDAMAGHRLIRTDFVVALGGGVVGDLAGLASSLYMRGIGLIQVPTTILSMVDSSVGGKTAVNLEVGKNLAGVFRNPDLVITDVSTLQTLDSRELRAGFYELIKHGIIGSQTLLDQTMDFLERWSLDDFKKHFGKSDFVIDLENLLISQINQKARVVEGDAQESVENDSPRSRKILNFGHTIGHALERVTDYTHFKHGEAVGYGMLVETEIAKLLDIIDQNSINSINNVVQQVGQLPDLSIVDFEAVVDAVKLDKKSTGTSLKWVLIERVGKPVIKDGSVISDDLIRIALTNALL